VVVCCLIGEGRAEDVDMSPIKVIAIVLIVAGIAGLAYGQFSYTEKKHEAKLGPLDFSVKEKKTVNVPVWAGIAAILGGGVLLFVKRA
jgi:LPXTG-motif cell wall-anchored protein